MILDKIVSHKKEEVAVLKEKGIVLPEQFSDMVIDRPRGFKKALLEFPGISVIAEVKKASPSKGIICADFNPVSIAVNYAKNNAQAISVLTDAAFFQGSLLYLMQVRQAVSLPILRKDFIIDLIQIDEARAHGADAILLIASLLQKGEIKDFREYAAEFGMDSLVEVHDEAELEKSLAAGADLIGVNNRNLKDFSVDIQTSFRLKKLIPAHIPMVSESGLSGAADLLALKDAGIKAALIGESLMRAGETSNLLGNLR